MSLLDTFRPKWQNSNPDKRLEAIDELDAQDTLERIALSDENNDETDPCSLADIQKRQRS